MSIGSRVSIIETTLILMPWSEPIETIHNLSHVLLHEQSIDRLGRYFTRMIPNPVCFCYSSSFLSNLCFTSAEMINMAVHWIPEVSCMSGQFWPELRRGLSPAVDVVVWNPGVNSRRLHPVTTRMWNEIVL
jgi:hypothetical protein